MQAVSMNPRVTHLARKREVLWAQAGRHESGEYQSGETRSRDFPRRRLLVHTLRRAASAGTDMALSQAVVTPLGSLPADIVLQRGRRRIVIQVGRATGEAETALLVYGGFDVVYRVSAHDARLSVTSIAALLENAEPEIFGSTGAAFLSGLSSIRRIERGRRTMHAVRWDGSLGASLHRRRISRPADWATRFERLVSKTHQRRAS
jgi:hypothetical protein